MSLVDLRGQPLVLGSASPRRGQLLTSAGLEFEVSPADVDESPRPGEAPVDYVIRLSASKAAAVSADWPAAVVVAADTTVDVDGQILGKPLDAGDLRRMLRLLAGRTHLVHTGVTVSLGDGCEGAAPASAETIAVSTEVTFAQLSDRDIEWYVSTGDGFDKAGGYGIQGMAAVLVERVAGSVTNVIGLPLAETVAQIRRVVNQT